ncbi:hypothetical protein Hanom_Chr03g00189451 [Helianthus anomalus]
MTTKNETECVQKLPHAGPGFRSCIRVRKTCVSARVQPNSSSETHFLFYMWNLICFQSITYFLYFFSLCAFFLK